jgi:O-antigen ligase
MVLMGTSVAILGMVQRFAGVEKIYGVWRPLLRTDSSFFGPYVNPNHFAGYMALIIPIALVVFIRQVERVGRGKRWMAGNYLRRLDSEDSHRALFLLLSLVLMVSGLFLSLSRGGVLAFVGSIIFVVVILSIREGWRWMLVLGLIIGLFVALFLYWLGFAPFQVEVKTFENLFQDPDVQTRIQIWKDAWKTLLDFPLFGTGLGTFAHIYPKYKTILDQATVMYPESDFFQILVENGVLGLGVFVWLFVAFFHNLWVRWTHRDRHEARINPKVMVGLMAAIVAMLIQGIGDFNLHIPANALQCTIVMGLAMVVMVEKTKAEG